MIKLHVKIEYPCGLKTDHNVEEISLLSFIAPIADIDTKDGCPLHGKDCNAVLMKKKPSSNRAHSNSGKESYDD